MNDRYGYKTDKKWDHYKCRDCKTIFIDPMPTKKDLDKIYNSKGYRFFWESDYKKNIAVRYHLEEGKTDVFLKKIKNRGGNILDIGCNLGTFLNKVKPYFSKFYGVEYSKDVLKYIDRHQIKVTNDIKSLQDNFFDVVCMWDVIEHLIEPDYYLNEVYRVLKKGGQLILSTPNADSLTLRMIKEKWHQVEPPSHVYLFSKKSMSKMLESYGFKNIRITCDSQFGCNPPISIYYIFSRIFGFNSKTLEEDVERLDKKEFLPVYKKIVYLSYRRLSSLISYPFNISGYGDNLLVVTEKI